MAERRKERVGATSMRVEFSTRGRPMPCTPPRIGRINRRVAKLRPLVGAPEWFRDGPAARSWGVSAIPITYAPPARDASELAFEQQAKADAPDLAKCWLQKAPARQLPNLQKMPISLVSGEASFYAAYGHCLVKYLEQAGVHPTYFNLGAMGIHGNGHMMMLEKNSDQIADVMETWVRKSIAE